MIISIDWLKDFINIEETPEELSNMLYLLVWKLKVITSLVILRTSSLAKLYPYPIIQMQTG